VNVDEFEHTVVEQQARRDQLRVLAALARHRRQSAPIEAEFDLNGPVGCPARELLNHAVDFCSATSVVMDSTTASPVERREHRRDPEVQREGNDVTQAAFQPPYAQDGDDAASGPTHPTRSDGGSTDVGGVGSQQTQDTGTNAIAPPRLASEGWIANTVSGMTSPDGASHWGRPGPQERGGRGRRPRPRELRAQSSAPARPVGLRGPAPKAPKERRTATRQARHKKGAERRRAGGVCLCLCAHQPSGGWQQQTNQTPSGVACRLHVTGSDSHATHTKTAACGASSLITPLFLDSASLIAQVIACPPPALLQRCSLSSAAALRQ
jgi:hypothetical protein